MNRVLEGTQWGGFVEIATALWNTDTEAIVVHAEGIHAKATDIEVEAGIYPAMLAGLPSGAPKKKRVYLVLKGKHYHVGTVKKGGITRMIFDIGKDSEEAQKHIVEYLKAQNKGPLAELTTAERAEEVKKAIAKQRGPTKPTNGSYASKAAAAGSLNSAPKQAPPKRPEPRGAATGKSPDRCVLAIQKHKRMQVPGQVQIRPCRFGSEQLTCPAATQGTWMAGSWWPKQTQKVGPRTRRGAEGALQGGLTSGPLEAGTPEVGPRDI